MSPDTIVDVYCEICEERIATARIGDLRYPMTGEMYLSPDEHHGYPAPFAPGAEWEYMRCPHCNYRPFLCEDRIHIGDRYVYLTEEPDEEDAPSIIDESPGADPDATCPICGKTFPPAQLKTHIKNHRRTEARRKRKGAEAR